MRTPLHEAALSGNPEIVSLLLKAGAKVNERDINNCTPLHCGIVNPKYAREIVVILLKVLFIFTEAF